MENAVDALKIAAAVLVFVIAIGSSFSLFGTAKHTADSIITMRDKQAYLEAAELDNGILYTSSDYVTSENATGAGVDSNGNRIVNVSDVISTIYRYSKEKYGVTIIKSDGTVIARYDSNTDSVMTQWNKITDDSKKVEFVDSIKARIDTTYVKKENIELDIASLYTISIEGGSGSITVGAPWYGNEEEIQKKIGCDLNGTVYTKNEQKYEGINLLDTLKNATTIIEVINEIDNSTYLKQTDDNGTELTDENGNAINSNLLQQYEMPTVEIVYIL